jgi:hypothetical protein
MAEASIHFFESSADATAKFEFYRTVGFAAVMIGPASLSTAAATQISNIDDSKQYYVVIGTNADAVADPTIKPPPP